MHDQKGGRTAKARGKLADTVSSCMTELGSNDYNSLRLGYAFCRRDELQRFSVKIDFSRETNLNNLLWEFKWKNNCISMANWLIYFFFLLLIKEFTQKLWKKLCERFKRIIKVSTRHSLSHCKIGYTLKMVSHKNGVSEALLYEWVLVAQWCHSFYLAHLLLSMF